MKPSSISSIMALGKVVTAAEGRMTAYEIRQSYANAKYPKEQIKILAQLNLCTTADIKAILEHKADELPPPGSKPKKQSNRKPRISPEVWQEINEKYKSGEYTKKKLAEMYGVSQATLSNHINVSRETASLPDTSEQDATELREGAERNEPAPIADRIQYVYELAAEIVEYIGQKYREVDRISVTKDANEIYVLVGHKNASIEITQKKGEPEDEQPYYQRSRDNGRRGI